MKQILPIFLFISGISTQDPCFDVINPNASAIVIPFTIKKGGFKCQADASSSKPLIFVSPAKNPLELVKVEVELTDGSNEIQVMATNGRDSQTFAVPRENGDHLDLSAGRALLPLLDEDFETGNPMISITLMARSARPSKFRLTVRGIARPQYNVELTQKKPKRDEFRFAGLTTSSPIEHRITMEKTQSLLRIRVNSTDHVCMRAIILAESSALRHNDLLPESLNEGGTFRKHFFLNYKPLQDEPLIVRYLVTENDEICGTNTLNSKKREKRIEISYEMVNEESFVRPIGMIIGGYLILMFLPILPAAIPLVHAYLTKANPNMALQPKPEEALRIENGNQSNAMIRRQAHDPLDGEWHANGSLRTGGFEECIPMHSRTTQPNDEEEETLIGNRVVDRIQSHPLEIRNGDEDRIDEPRPAPDDYMLIQNMNNEMVINQQQNRLDSLQFALFLLPIIIQIGIAHFQKPANSSLDECYHNFECAHRWGRIESLNHIVSNIGYAFASLFYLCFISIRAKSKWRLQEHESQIPTGVFPNHHLEYAMAVSLFCESIASAVYHICPSKHSYKFDTPFIVIVCLLGMMKLYGSRHGRPSNAQFHFLIALALMVDLGVSQLAEHRWTWPFQAILLIFVLLFGLFKVYTGKHFLERPMRPNFFERLRANYQGRCLLFVASLNVALVVPYFFVHTYVHSNQLVVFFVVLNFVLYIGYYLLMKRYFRENLSNLTKGSLVLALIFWSFALYFFSNEQADWTLSPAESRELNSACVVFGFFDSHDLWHLLSAMAAVFSLITISTIDDPTSSIHILKRSVF